jgi:hypothetical protein
MTSAPATASETTPALSVTRQGWQLASCPADEFAEVIVFAASPVAATSPERILVAGGGTTAVGDLPRTGGCVWWQGALRLVRTRPRIRTSDLCNTQDMSVI